MTHLFWDNIVRERAVTFMRTLIKIMFFPIVIPIKIAKEVLDWLLIFMFLE